MSKVKPAEDTQQKVVTKYDRKVEERKLKEAKEKRAQKISKIVGIMVAICLVVGIAAAIAISVHNKNTAINGTYVKIGDHEVTKVEYDYYYNTIINNYLEAYSSYLPYIGLDTSVDYDQQMYSETMTWKDAFDNMTVTQLQETKALVDDAVANGFEYETAADDYASFEEGFAAQAEAAGASVEDFYKAMFGDYATVARLKPYIENTLLASAYYNHLVELNAPTDEEITAYYEENKNQYDTVDYRSFSFAAQLPEDATDEDTDAAMDAAEAKANEMLEKLQAGGDFAELCVEYATEEQKADYEDTETDKSLTTGGTYSMISSSYSDWLYDDARVEGDVTVAVDRSTYRCYVVEFINKAYSDTTESSISATLATNAVSEYEATLQENYPVTDVAGKLKYLTIPETTDEATEEVTEEVAEEETEETTEE